MFIIIVTVICFIVIFLISAIACISCIYQMIEMSKCITDIKNDIAILDIKIKHILGKEYE